MFSIIDCLELWSIFPIKTENQLEIQISFKTYVLDVHYV